MPQYKVKFHGTMQPKERIQKMEMIIVAEEAANVIDKLRKMGFVKINGLKVRQVI